MQRNNYPGSLTAEITHLKKLLNKRRFAASRESDLWHRIHRKTERVKFRRSEEWEI